MLNRRQVISTSLSSSDWYRSRLCVHNNQRALGQLQGERKQHAAPA